MGREREEEEKKKRRMRRTKVQHPTLDQIPQHLPIPITIIEALNIHLLRCRGALLPSLLALERRQNVPSLRAIPILLKLLPPQSHRSNPLRRPPHPRPLNQPVPLPRRSGEGVVDLLHRVLVDGFEFGGGGGFPEGEAGGGEDFVGPFGDGCAEEGVKAGGRGRR